MRVLNLCELLVVAFLGCATFAYGMGHKPAARPDPPPTPLTKRISKARDRTHACERQLGLKRTPVSSKRAVGLAYQRWILTTWRTRAQVTCGLARELGHPVAAIRAVWGPAHADEALNVARCESGHSMTPRAHNGQYLGMFQMGEYARSRYGHGDTPLEQARAAHGYWQDAGWSPWQCSPYGGLNW